MVNDSERDTDSRASLYDLLRPYGSSLRVRNIESLKMALSPFCKDRRRERNQWHDDSLLSLSFLVAIVRIVNVRKLRRRMHTLAIRPPSTSCRNGLRLGRHRTSEEVSVRTGTRIGTITRDNRNEPVYSVVRHFALENRKIVKFRKRLSHPRRL